MEPGATSSFSGPLCYSPSLHYLSPAPSEGLTQWERQIEMRLLPSWASPCVQWSAFILTKGHDHSQQQEGLHVDSSDRRHADGLAQILVSGGPSFGPGPLTPCSHSVTLEKGVFKGPTTRSSIQGDDLGHTQITQRVSRRTSCPFPTLWNVFIHMQASDPSRPPPTPQHTHDTVRKPPHSSSD